MKTLHCFIFFIALSIMPSFIKAQSVVCNSLLNVSVDANCTATILPDMVLQGGASNFPSLSLDKSFFTGQDLGANVVTLTGVNTNGETSTCTSTIFLEDKLAPNLILINGSIVTLDNNNTYQLNESDVVLSVTENCGTYTPVISPSVITCGMANPVTVTVTVIDDSGNTASGLALVYYNEPSSSTLTCDSDVQFIIPAGGSVIVKPQDLLDNYQGGCIDATWVDLEVNGVNRANNTLSYQDAGSSIVGTVNGLGSQCWANITVINDVNCTSQFLESNIVWPTSPLDLGLVTCQSDPSTLRPEILQFQLGLDSADLYPIFVNLDSCHVVSTFYQDQVILGPPAKVLRTWTALDWVTASVYDNVQVIYIDNDIPFICDILPWDAPIGDCASGHTLDDNVEWPRDVTINSPAVLPAQLVNNPAVDPRDARPEVIDPLCTNLYIDYDDVLTSVGGVKVVERTWRIFTWQGELGTYTQKIQVDYNAGTTYCAIRKNGDPIPGVEMAPGFITDATGCIDMAGYSGSTMTPDKYSPPAEGIDVNDQLAMYEHILGIRPFDNVYQSRAADISTGGNGTGVSTVDLLLLERMMQGIHLPDSADIWRFYDYISDLETVDVNQPNDFNMFVGVKLGDVNDSYDLSTSQRPPNPSTEFALKDEVLNAGQTYKVQLFPTKSGLITGFNLSFKSNDDITIKNVLGNLLPEFSFQEAVTVNDGVVNINYKVPSQIMNEDNGVMVDPTVPLLTLFVKSDVNGILNQELLLTDNAQSFVKYTREEVASEIVLEWEGIIINKTEEAFVINEMKVAPNPTSDVLRVQLEGDQSAKRFYIINKIGQQVMAGDVALDLIMVSQLQPDVYFIQVEDTEGGLHQCRFIKM